MSSKAIDYVLAKSTHTGCMHHLLVILAHHMHADGTGAFPSLATLAHESRLHRNTIKRYLPRLAASGDLEITRPSHRGPGHSNRYAFPGLRAIAAQEQKQQLGSGRAQIGPSGTRIGTSPRTKSHSNVLTSLTNVNVTVPEQAQAEPNSQPPTTPTDPRTKQEKLYARFRDSYRERHNKAGEPLCSMPPCPHPRNPGPIAWFCTDHGDPAHNYATPRVH